MSCQPQLLLGRGPDTSPPPAQPPFSCHLQAVGFVAAVGGYRGRGGLPWSAFPFLSPRETCLSQSLRWSSSFFFKFNLIFYHHLFPPTSSLPLPGLTCKSCFIITDRRKQKYARQRCPHLLGLFKMPQQTERGSLSRL